MATPPPPPVSTLPESLPSTPETAPPFLKSASPAKTHSETSTQINIRQPSPPNFITIPSYSKWFSFQTIHQTERRFLPEFFTGKCPSKNPTVYKYFRDTIVKRYRKDPSRKVTFTEVRKVIVGDVGAIRRVFDFLEAWGLINYTTSAAKTKGDDKENKSGSSLNNEGGGSQNRKFCSGCKEVCSIACFYSDKHDLTVCARCYVRSSYPLGLTSADFRRVEISEEAKTGWSDKETLHLLEALTHYGDDWKKVAEHVGGRTEKECVARFINLPFGEQFVGHPDSDEVDKYYLTKDNDDGETEEGDDLSQVKRRRLTPFADASNPIMTQAAFLSAMVGSEVAESAAQAAVAALSDVDIVVDQRCREKNNGSPSNDTQQKDTESAAAANSNTTVSLKEAVLEAQALIKKEEQDLERSVSHILEVQMREIQEKIVQFEDAELLMERERQQLQQMKNLLLADRMALMCQRTNSPPKIGEREGVKSTDAAIT